MSGLSFRPRPIDISKPIPIIRADSEDYEEIIKLAVTVPKIATGMDPEDEEVRRRPRHSAFRGPSTNTNRTHRTHRTRAHRTRRTRGYNG